MKNISTILSIVAIAIAITVHFVDYHQIQDLKNAAAADKKTGPANTFKIAYFDMDSVQAHYDYFKEAQGTVKEQENAMNMQLSSLDRENQKKIDAWRSKGNQMTQAEGEQAQQEYQAMQQQFAARKQSLEQDLYKHTEDLKNGIRKKIEDYLKDYNKDKRYTYVIEYDPGSFIYNKDSLYNITNDLVDGLNAEYKKKPR